MDMTKQTKIIRQPIVTVAGHVDHGKTSLLDKIRCSCVAAKEHGGITQKISFTLFPLKELKKSCPLISKQNIKLEIPGFLFIDTPGHAAFTNLRKRGGSLADLAILVIDINEGIKPQTAEVISILKSNKTPFIIALNKIDNISSWRKQSEDLRKNIENQSALTKEQFNEKLLTLIGSLQSHGFESDLFFNINDFTKKIALVPCSARTGEGVPEILLVLAGLSEKFLMNKLSLGEESKGVILEIKKQKEMNYLESILYDGVLKKGDEIIIASFNEPIITKIRGIEEILPLSEKFESKEKVTASTGIRLQLTDKVEVLPGMPFQIYKGNIEKIKQQFKNDLSEIKTDKKGIITKADSLGSLEALLTLLKQANIPVLKAGIGSINKQDLVMCRTILENNPENAVIIGFNVKLDSDINEKEIGKVKILAEEVIYKLIENLQAWQEERRKEIEKERLFGLATICKLEILHQYIFHNTKPAIFGVKVLAGKIIPNLPIITENYEEIGRIKNIQSENKSVNKAEQGEEVAISIPGANYEREISDKKFLYSNISEKQFKDFKKNKDLLSPGEISALQEISQIKRKEKADWGV